MTVATLLQQHLLSKEKLLAQSLRGLEADLATKKPAEGPICPDYAVMPAARNAQAMECTVEPGDLLFLPAGWFHQVQSLTLSLSANLWAYDTPLALNPIA